MKYYFLILLFNFLSFASFSKDNVQTFRTEDVRIIDITTALLEKQINILEKSSFFENYPILSGGIRIDRFNYAEYQAAELKFYANIPAVLNELDDLRIKLRNLKTYADLKDFYDKVLHSDDVRDKFRFLICPKKEDFQVNDVYAVYVASLSKDIIARALGVLVDKSMNGSNLEKYLLEEHKSWKKLVKDKALHLLQARESAFYLRQGL